MAFSSRTVEEFQVSRSSLNTVLTQIVCMLTHLAMLQSEVQDSDRLGPMSRSLEEVTVAMFGCILRRRPNGDFRPSPGTSLPTLVDSPSTTPAVICHRLPFNPKRRRTVLSSPRQ